MTLFSFPLHNALQNSMHPHLDPTHYPWPNDNRHIRHYPVNVVILPWGPSNNCYSLPEARSYCGPVKFIPSPPPSPQALLSLHCNMTVKHFRMNCHGCRKYVKEGQNNAIPFLKHSWNVVKIQLNLAMNWVKEDGEHLSISKDEMLNVKC